MSDKAKVAHRAETSASAYNPRRFRSTVPFYARYRLGYPESLIARVAALQAGDAVLDLGCGPGLLAIPLARLGFAVTAVDPEPDMVAACEAAAREAGVTVKVLRGSSFEMPAGLGPFKLVTMGRSFHWMDREATLALLDGMVTLDGAIALFDDSHPATVENAWHGTVREIAERYGRGTSPNVQMRAAPDFRSDASLLMESGFPRVRGLSEFVRRTLSVDDIVGLSFSMSTTSPERLGDRAATFEAELRAALAALSPDGAFTEIAEIKALVAQRS
ncbi:MAG: class I SAM-dependent methyltransferase [Proteobacteria bacterium]|nr:class I SAM-dependent methyltransferase [Pseudomonadota bacterium]